MAQARFANVMIDLNVLLDVLLARAPWLADSRAIWEAHDQGMIFGHIAAHALTNLFYMSRRIIGVDQAREAVRLCLQTFQIAPVGRLELELADHLAGNDIEDSLVVACAIHGNLDAIVTRDLQGFANSPLPILTPTDLLAQLFPADEVPPR